MKRIFGNKVVSLLLIITVSVSVILGVINATRTKSTIMENIALVTVTPLQNGFSWIGEKITGFFGYFGSVDELRAKNDELESENRMLAQKNRRAKGFEDENKELRELLGLKEAYPEMELVAAEVVSRSSSNWYENFTINKGSSDGLKIGQGVITTDNVLVGRIGDIGSTWAKVTTIIDSGHSVGAMVVRSGELAVIKGESALSDKGQCKLSFISKNSDIVVGDFAETSGLGGIYPKGIEIGKVVKVESDVQGISKYAIIETSVDISSVSKVMVITDNMTKD